MLDTVLNPGDYLVAAEPEAAADQETKRDEYAARGQLAVDLEQALSAARPRLLRLAHRRGVTPDAADDVVQETLIEAWQHLDHMRSPERFDAWLDGICRNVSLRWARMQLAALFAQRIGVTRTFWLSVVGWGVVALVYARLTSFFPAVAVLFFLGVMNAVFNATAAPLIIQSTSRNFIGRVMAVFNPLFSLVGMFSVAIAGYLDSTVLHSLSCSLTGYLPGSNRHHLHRDGHTRHPRGALCNGEPA